MIQSIGRRRLRRRLDGNLSCELITVFIIGYGRPQRGLLPLFDKGVLVGGVCDAEWDGNLSCELTIVFIVVHSRPRRGLLPRCGKYMLVGGVCDAD